MYRANCASYFINNQNVIFDFFCNNNNLNNFQLFFQLQRFMRTKYFEADRYIQILFEAMEKNIRRM